MRKKKKPTICEVADMAGVSRQTVSRVLNNHPDVAEETRNKILEVMRRLEYRPNAVARSLIKQTTNCIGLVTAGLEFIGPSVTMSGITKKAEQLGYGVYVKELPRFNPENIQYIIDWFLTRQVDGIIWAVPEIGDNRSWIDDFTDKIEVPIIFLTAADRLNVSTVVIDNYQGAKIATDHIISRGKKKIAHISGPLDWWESKQRFLGWQDALIREGIKPNENMVAEGNWSSKSGKKAFDQLLYSFPEMDAIFVANDQMALAVLHTACEKGINIPKDLLVVGFDNIPESEFFYPSLTTVSQDLLSLGCLAVEELIYLIRAKNLKQTTSKHNYRVLQPSLIIRKSSGLGVTSKYL